MHVKDCTYISLDVNMIFKEELVNYGMGKHHQPEHPIQKYKCCHTGFMKTRGHPKSNKHLRDYIQKPLSLQAILSASKLLRERDYGRTN